MNIGVVTFEVPPFNYKSLWWWLLSKHDNSNLTFELIGPSGEHQFQRRSFDNGTAHLLNIYANEETKWTEREKVEFSVKAYVYLSKLQSSNTFDRFVIADCSGIEPLLAANLSVLAPVWVKKPIQNSSDRGKQGRGLMHLADETFNIDNIITEESLTTNWPPDSDKLLAVINNIFE